MQHKHQKSQTSPYGCELRTTVDIQLAFPCKNTFPFNTRGWSCKSVPAGRTNKSEIKSSCFTWVVFCRVCKADSMSPFRISTRTYQGLETLMPSLNTTMFRCLNDWWLVIPLCTFHQKHIALHWYMTRLVCVALVLIMAFYIFYAITFLIVFWLSHWTHCLAHCHHVNIYKK